MTTQPRPIVMPPPRAAQQQAARRWVYVLAACVALAAVGGMYALDQRHIQVQAVSPTYQDIESTVSSTGVVVPAHDFQARANFSGIVEKIYVQLGQKVHPGQMLVRMKDQYATPRLDTARAALKASEVSLENMQRNGSQDDRIGFASDLERAEIERESAANRLATLRQLAQRGSVSDAEVQAGEQRLKLANATLQTLKRRMTHRYTSDDVESEEEKVAADKAALNAERISWANANMSTPIAGTVYIIPVSRYDFVPMGGELLHVADLSKLEVRANFYEPDIGKLETGAPVTIRWEGAPGKSWQGTITSRPLAINRNGPLSTGESLIALGDTHGELPVNSSVTVVATVQKHAHVLTIPRAALQSSGSGYFTYRIVDGRLRKTPVKAGLFNAMSVEITSGLKSSDEIALRAMGDERLGDGRRVETER